MEATDRAAELGSAHGKAAAEALAAHCLGGPNADEPAGVFVDEDGDVSCRSCWSFLPLPVPDLSGDVKAFYAKVGLRPPAFRGPVAPAEGESIDAWDSFYAMSDKWETFDMECQDAYDAYCDAFTAAVEQTIREAVGTL